MSASHSRAPRKEIPRRLVRHDWDFRGCPESELATCFRYEYCRESNVAEFVRRYRMIRKRIRPGLLDSLEQQNLSVLWVFAEIDCFASVPDFPETPWLDLPEETRARIVTTVKDCIQEWSLFGAIEVVSGPKTYQGDWKTWLSVKQSYIPKGLCGWFSIRPGFTKEQVKAAFAARLDEIERDCPDLFSKQPAGRGRARDRLKQLGALRLLEGRSPKLATRYVQQQLAEKISWYSSSENGESWYRARDTASKLVKQFDQAVKPFLGLLRRTGRSNP